MLQIIFSALNDDENISEAVREYESIWKSDGEKMVLVLERNSNLQFKIRNIECIIYEGKSSSHPFKLRASYSLDVKRATIIHELSHILLSDNEIKFQSSLEAHRKINPFLYKTWKELYGAKFADRMIIEEIKRGEIYKEAWDFFGRYSIKKFFSQKNRLIILLVFFSSLGLISAIMLFDAGFQASNRQGYWLTSSINSTHYVLDNEILNTLYLDHLEIPIPLLRVAYTSYYWATTEQGPSTSTVAEINSVQDYLSKTNDASRKLFLKDQEKKADIRNSVNNESSLYFLTFIFQFLTLGISIRLASLK